MPMKPLVILGFYLLGLFKLSIDKLFGQHLIQIALNVNDCNVCIENLKKLNALDTAYAIRIVAKESERDFANDIISLIKPEPHDIDLVFSNDLYHSLILAGNISSISMLNEKYNTTSKRYSLKSELSNEFIAYLNSLNKDTVTFNFNQRFDMIAAENIVYADHIAYSYSSKMPYVLRLDFIHRKVDTFLKINPTIERQAYHKLFRKDDELQQQLNFLEKNNISGSSIQKVVINALGNITLSVHYTYFKVKDKDTLATRFTAIQEFSKQGKLLATHLINPDKLLTRVDASCFVRAGEFAFDGDTLLISLVYPKYGKEDKKVNGFLAKFVLDNNGDYNFYALPDKKLPGVYDDYGYFYTQPVFSNNLNYIGVLLSDSIFGFKGNKDIAGHIFKEPQYSGDKLAFKYSINSIDQFGAYLYLTYYDKTNGVDLFFVKYNLNTKRIDLKKKLVDRIKENNLFFMFFDQKDPDYYYLKAAANRVMRIRV